jgi:hypothetical protein
MSRSESLGSVYGMRFPWISSGLVWICCREGTTTSHQIPALLEAVEILEQVIKFYSILF